MFSLYRVNTPGNVIAYEWWFMMSKILHILDKALEPLH